MSIRRRMGVSPRFSGALKLILTFVAAPPCQVCLRRRRDKGEATTGPKLLNEHNPLVRPPWRLLLFSLRAVCPPNERITEANVFPVSLRWPTLSYFCCDCFLEESIYSLAPGAACLVVNLFSSPSRPLSACAIICTFRPAVFATGN